MQPRRTMSFRVIWAALFLSCLNLSILLLFGSFTCAPDTATSSATSSIISLDTTTSSATSSIISLAVVIPFWDGQIAQVRNQLATANDCGAVCDPNLSGFPQNRYLVLHYHGTKLSPANITLFTFDWITTCFAKFSFLVNPEAGLSRILGSDRHWVDMFEQLPSAEIPASVAFQWEWDVIPLRSYWLDLLHQEADLAHKLGFWIRGGIQQWNLTQKVSWSFHGYRFSLASTQNHMNGNTLTNLRSSIFREHFVAALNSSKFKRDKERPFDLLWSFRIEEFRIFNPELYKQARANIQFSEFMQDWNSKTWLPPNDLLERVPRALFIHTKALFDKTLNPPNGKPLDYFKPRA